MSMRALYEHRRLAVLAVLLFGVLATGCAKKQPPIARPTPPPPPPPSHGPRAPPCPAGARRRTAGGRRAPSVGRRPGLAVAGRPQPRIALQAGVLRLRQHGGERGRPVGART